MFGKKFGLFSILSALLIFTVIDTSTVQAYPCKILVVMSYEESNPWCREIKEGIDTVLEGRCKTQYFYMNTKRNFKAGPQKAKEAYDLYLRLRPDGVIAADDNAQSMFVVPYLKDKVKTPIMFCGVNDDATKYGYPATNVSGILERSFISESIAFAKQLIPSINTVGFITKDSPSGQAILKQVESESHTYIAKLTGFKLVQTIRETLVAVDGFKKTSDLLFVDATNGILDTDGKPLNNKQVTQIVTKAFGKPVIGTNDFHVQYGALCAVVKSGQNQGRVAADMLVKALNGMPIEQMPIRVNKHGKRMMNVSVMKSLGIRPKRRALIGTELVIMTD